MVVTVFLFPSLKTKIEARSIFGFLVYILAFHSITNSFSTQVAKIFSSCFYMLYIVYRRLIFFAITVTKGCKFYLWKVWKQAAAFPSSASQHFAKSRNLVCFPHFSKFQSVVGGWTFANIPDICVTVAINEVSGEKFFAAEEY